MKRFHAIPTTWIPHKKWKLCALRYLKVEGIFQSHPQLNFSFLCAFSNRANWTNHSSGFNSSEIWTLFSLEEILIESVPLLVSLSIWFKVRILIIRLLRQFFDELYRVPVHCLNKVQITWDKKVNQMWCELDGKEQKDYSIKTLNSVQWGDDSSFKEKSHRLDSRVLDILFLI